MFWGLFLGYLISFGIIGSIIIGYLMKMTKSLEQIAEILQSKMADRQK
jgi:hypothetical protein